MWSAGPRTFCTWSMWSLLLSQLALKPFFALKLVRLTCGKSRHFLQIFQEKQRETFVFFWPSTKPPWHHKNWYLYHGWSLHIHVPKSALYLLSRTWQTKKGSSGRIYNFQRSYPLVKVKRIWNFNSDFLSGFAGRWCNFPFFKKKKLTKMLCGAINNQTNKRWMSSE